MLGKLVKFGSFVLLTSCFASFCLFGSNTAGFEFKIPDDYCFFCYKHCSKCSFTHFFQYTLYKGIDHGYYYADFPVTGNSENFTFSLSKLCCNCRGYCNFINKDTFKITKDHVHFVDMNKPSGNHTSGQVHIMSLPSGEDVHTASYQNNTSTNQIIRVLDFWSGEYLGNTNSNGGLVLTGTVPEDAATNCVMSVELSPGETYIVPDITEGGGFVFNVAVPNFSANDNDGDGLTFDEEYDLGTCDNKRDTDGDGLEDKTEIVGTSITVHVHGKPPKALLARTKPAYYDTDRDGLSDSAEILGIGGFATDPNDPDCDKDGIPDGFDPDHLTAFVVDGDEMPAGWVSVWRALGQRAGMPPGVLDNLRYSSFDCNGDGKSNAQELQHGRQPLFASDYFRLDFGEITRVYTNNVLNLNFYLSIFAPHSVTGAVLISKSNWSAGILRGSDNYELYDFLPDFPEYHAAPFVASLGLSNKFNFSFSQHALNSLTVTNENIRVYILGKGWLPDQKTIYVSEVLPDVEGYVSPPVLLSPADNAEYLGEENSVSFQWDTNALTSLWSLSVVDGGDFIDVDHILTTAHSFTTNLSLPAKYYWNVSAVSADGKLVRSEERRVVVKWPNADNDGDGFNDGYEFEHGSDWNDPDSVPVTMQGTNFFSSAAGLLISMPLSASTGVPPYKWKVDRGKLPSGLKLNGNAIQGAPQIEGRYAFRLRLSDMARTFQLIDCVYEVTPGREKTLKKFGPARFVPQSE